MMEFYEKIREEDGIYVNRSCKSHVFAAHFHINPEILVVNKGGYDLTVSGRKYSVTAGDIAVIDSYETHSYDVRHPSDSYDDIVLILPYSLIGKLMTDPEGRYIAEPVIHSPELCREIFDISQKYLLPDVSEATRRSAVSLMVSRIYEKAVMDKKRKGGEAALLRRILSFIQDNFRGNISRGAIAKEIGYTEAHISRVFHSYIGKGISEYVNGLRLAYIDRMIAEGDKRSLTELIFEAGFGSQQTYFRAKKKESVRTFEKREPADSFIMYK